MEKVTIEAEVRQENASVKKLKKEGKIPAVIYGKETKTMPIEIRIKDIEKTVKTLQEGTILITLKLTDHDKKEEKTVIIKEVSRHPVTDEIIHADLHAVTDSKKGRFEVPVFTTGLAEGVKAGGVLEHIARHINVKCFPKDLPSRIDLDVSALMINDEIKVSDIKLKEGVEIMDNPKFPVVIVKGIKVEAAAVPGAAVPGAEAAKEPEVIKGAPKAEEAAPAAGKAGAKGAPAGKAAPAAKAAPAPKKK